ncbi:phenylalanine--tRNA ligase subunit alpha [candidate division WWE3 bacterium CG09_land_8_20_14_0_10_39_24]|uniref:phenylalanine--tRNA ligase n=1 Tax=candidate division WWE3 bacterium CG09_land_8_20_14_0_10_39_24 TaxID=1975088 RepID=A0A2H0WJ41_UNCKA|nr:MAG: phenylalanine--tRNA ligase subunit alpha [bacterium CG09_39_24]PIS12676.1 MAG: phenylalanine--tRNA ligase subunit alpha [candidate division WWE3 bacterium CG09_land_8_20_14_0_10_39_24]PJE50897.1 MAG: phenylalanine--tRNA ligase subunit alpha [candidate division WWE3 bacterium CG10_big_fil_rev_8_21_14_0_10_39_14]
MEKLQALKKTFNSDIKNTDDSSEMLDNLYIKYLGKKGAINNIISEFVKLYPNQKKEWGPRINTFKKEVETALKNLQQKTLSSENVLNSIDITLPGIKPHIGHTHPITQMKHYAENIFLTMGFKVVDSLEVDDDFNHFETLNFPKGHPARDMWDTFWTEDHLLPIAHTSTMQHRILKTHTPPFRVIIPGKCFRYEATDTVHEHTFYQIEGMYVSKDTSLAELIGVLETFIYTYYRYKIPYKIQPTFFPFVEPGLELLVEHKLKSGEKKWLELIPAGMIHPNVLKMAGLDPNTYKGFAWAIGLDRLVMLKYGISDIRAFHKGDLRFLQQF